MPSTDQIANIDEYKIGEISSDLSSFIVAIEKIDVPKDHPRKDIEESSLEELTADIQNNGILNPLLVEKQPTYSEKDARFTLHSGLRRLLAAKKLKLKTVPIRLKSVSNLEKKTAIQLSENIQRKDLNAVEIAQCIRLFLELNIKEKEIAKLVSKSPAWVTKYKKISKMPLEILKDPYALKASLSDLLTLESHFPSHADLIKAWDIYKSSGIKSALNHSLESNSQLEDGSNTTLDKTSTSSINSVGVMREILIVTKNQHVFNCKMQVNEKDDECQILIPKNVNLEELKDIFDKIIQSMDPS